MFLDQNVVFASYVVALVFAEVGAKKDESLMLRDTTHFFLLAYFFPTCELEGSLPTTRMVRTGATTCFRTPDTEHLENVIVQNLSEPGDWILDLVCGGRELSLAGRKNFVFANK